ncbi:protein arginine methyltransferase NDUFAF7, mitochondrial-like, partial [Teratosphaeria destructans]
MRSRLSRISRHLSHNINRVNVHPFRVAGARCSSTTTTTAAADGRHQWSTPLAKQLSEAITTTGPISVASFMRQCLTGDLGGYYTPTDASPTRDQFGAKGDFVTSPEISQIFGELIGVWIVAEWIAQGRQSDGVVLIEVGPGRGTLMDDMLRTIRNFPPLAQAIEAVHLVEASENLRKAQHTLLCGENEMKQTDMGWESASKHAPDLKIIWTEDIRFVPRQGDKTPFIVAHEFFDALPIHVFQSVPPPPPGTDTLHTPTGPIPAPPPPKSSPPGNQWRELVVSPKPPHKLSPDAPEFELTLARAATPHSLYLPETSPRYRALKQTPGATIEISPDSHAYARDFAIRLGGSQPHPRIRPPPPPQHPSPPPRPSTNPSPPAQPSSSTTAPPPRSPATPSAASTNTPASRRSPPRAAPTSAPTSTSA